jgi:uncharacterized protein DUF6527
VKQSAFEHVFVDTVPPDLDEGKLYISIRHRTASHLCACGCGTKVVTPIKPPKWHLYFDGASVSLWPSIGRWQLPCRSHYWIEHGKVRWSRPWTPEEIEAGRIKDAEDLQRYYTGRDYEPGSSPVLDKRPQATTGLLARMRNRLFKDRTRHHR